jgi:hypothetical protein
MDREPSTDREANGWVEAVCGLPLVYGRGGRSIRQHFEPAGAHLGDRTAFLGAVGGWLRGHPEVIGAWQGYSEDKRAAGPYLDLNRLEVGLYDASAGYRDVRAHTDAVDACADFIYREAVWVLQCR